MRKKNSLINPWALCPLVLLLSAGFCAVVAKIYRLQIQEHKIWSHRASIQQEMRMDLESKRGTILAKMSHGNNSEYVPMVQDSVVYHLYIDAKAIPTCYKKGLADFLSALLQKDNKELFIEVSKNTRFRKLVWNLSLEQKNLIEKGFKNFIKKTKIPKNSLFFLSGYKRIYPMGSMAGSLIQTLGTQEGKRGPERVATGGLEKKLDPFLKGHPGLLMAHRTPKGRLDGTKVLKASQDGADVFLTINPLIQNVVETELEKAVIKARAKGGWVVMMEPQTGQIMALAQYPCLDLLNPKELLQDPIKKTYLNLKALTDPYEPGSIIKPFTMLCCLKGNRVQMSKKLKKIFDPEEKVSCVNGQFSGRKNPVKDVHRYSFLNMNMALQKSSNIYMAKAVEKLNSSLGDKFYSDELKNSFGLGNRTSLGIGPESSGFVPTPFKKTQKGLLEWSQGTPYSLAMGYNLLATTMQMTRLFSLIANKGKTVEPYLVEKIIQKNEQGLDEIIYDHASIKINQNQIIDPSDCERVLQAMQYAVNKGGTAFRAKIPGFSAAGKTATTEKLVKGAYSKDKHISTFAGIAPLNNPKLVCLIVIDEPEKFYIEGVGMNHFGGVCAAPSFSEMALKTLEILGVPPDDPIGTNDELKKLDELFKQWNH
jgi:cell division protein FtsI (penicillin-binding protein 3)